MKMKTKTKTATLSLSQNDFNLKTIKILRFIKPKRKKEKIYKQVR